MASLRWRVSYYWRRITGVLWDLCTLAIDTAACWPPYYRRSATDALVVRLDGIGDFLLWSGAAVRLANHYRSEGRRVILLVSAVCVELAENLRAFDEVWPLDRARFLSDLRYRFGLMRRVHLGEFGIAVQPTFSRELLFGDAVVWIGGRKERVGSVGDLSIRNPWQRWLGDRLYTRLIAAAPRPSTEMERNAEFLDGMGISGVDSLLRLELPAQRTVALARVLPKSDYFVVFPGAGWEGRRWPPANFAELARRISLATGWQVVVAGGPGDEAIAQALKAHSTLPMLNITGTTSLLELAMTLRDARLVIANETSAVHMAAAVGTRAFCILGGGHFGRFVPYAETAAAADATPHFAVHHMECFGCNWHCRYPREPGQPVACIQAITVDAAWTGVRALLPTTKDNV